jgi:hypothetical protein
MLTRYRFDLRKVGWYLEDSARWCLHTPPNAGSGSDDPVHPCITIDFTRNDIKALEFF